MNKRMKKKKEFKLKINKLYLYWYYMHFLRKYGILLFTQNLAVDAKSDLDMQLNFLDKGRECKVLIFACFNLQFAFFVNEFESF